MPKNWCFWTVVLENPLDCKVIKIVNPKWNQFWLFFGSTDSEEEAPILWPHDAESQLCIRKDPDAGKDWGQEKGMEEPVGWHHQFNGHEFLQTLRNSEGQGSLVCCSPWGQKEWDMTEWLKNNNTASVNVFYLNQKLWPKLSKIKAVDTVILLRESTWKYFTIKITLAQHLGNEC